MVLNTLGGVLSRARSARGGVTRAAGAVTRAERSKARSRARSARGERGHTSHKRAHTFFLGVSRKKNMAGIARHALPRLQSGF